MAGGVSSSTEVAGGTATGASYPVNDHGRMHPPTTSEGTPRYRTMTPSDSPAMKAGRVNWRRERGTLSAWRRASISAARGRSSSPCAARRPASRRHRVAPDVFPDERAADPVLRSPPCGTEPAIQAVQTAPVPHQQTAPRIAHDLPGGHDTILKRRRHHLHAAPSGMAASNRPQGPTTPFSSAPA